jgi:hypothetical protein
MMSLSKRFRITGFQNAKNGGWESLQTEIGKFLL